MSKSQEEIEQELVSRFVNNLEFLKEQYFDIFQKVELLSIALNDKLYTEKYVLEYIEESNDFNILDKEHKNYLYDDSLSSFNKKEIRSINLEKTKIFTNLSKDSYKIKECSYNMPETKYKLLEEYLSRDISNISSLFSGINTSNSYKYVDKMLFLGTLLGTHINSSITKVSPKVCFIIEPNLEIFRLSLFTTNYKALSQKTNILFSIMDERSIFMQKLNTFVSEYFQFSNYNIKYSKMSSFDNDLFNLILTKLNLENPFIFDYMKVLHDTSYFISKHISIYNIITLKKDKKSLDSFFNTKPVLFIGAGPSLSKNIDWIKKNQSKFIIVAMGAVYKKLFDNRIKVDVVTTADSQYEVLDNSHFSDEDVNYLKDVIVVASIGTPTKILNKFNQNKLFLFETYQSFKSNTNCYNGASIGEVTLSILLDMNIKSIYMIGIDLAIDEKTGRTHYEGYENSADGLENKLELNIALKGESRALREEFLEVSGLCKHKVITTRVFALSLSKYEEVIIEMKKEGQFIYNLSTDAAFIHGVNFMDKDKIQLDIIKNKNIYEIIKTNSSLGLNDKENSSLIERIFNLKELLSFIKRSLIEKKVKTLPQFLIYINELFENIIKTEDFFFSNLLANYFKVVLPYVYKSLNDEKVKPKVISKKIEETQSLILNQLENILNIYITYLNKIIK